ncbi:hypothetical protein Cs7R123_35570 [Catellatospora sp. TT07R-123]|uniref:hypothetical protein n=1 Tax=Catellatospora sp. TT07R-123 TaxID=2733863 RepID=UPI001B1E0A6C|nr:hypothetical protein [Catellatospora sp. TT07R-123]GHJ46215.1 hypothetical protein Cs7R123_35570 [Catellatospora sp. TT07R-123]
MDVTGQTDNAGRADLPPVGGADESATDGVAAATTAGQAQPTRAEADGVWSSAGAALEPGFEPLTPWRAAVADRRGIDALTGADPYAGSVARPVPPIPAAPNGHHRPMAPSPAGERHAYADGPLAEDPYADELAQASAEFARFAAFDEPTPAHGLPHLGAPPVFTPYQPTPLVPPAEVTPIPVMPPLAAAAQSALTMPTGAYPVPPPGLRPSLPAELSGPVPSASATDPPLAAMAEAATRAVPTAEPPQPEQSMTQPDPQQTPPNPAPAEPRAVAPRIGDIRAIDHDAADPDDNLSLGARWGRAFADAPLPTRPPVVPEPATPAPPLPAAAQQPPPERVPGPGRPDGRAGYAIPAQDPLGRAADGTAPQAAHGAAPQAAHGAAPQANHGAAPDAAHGAEPDADEDDEHLPQRVPGVPDVPPTTHPLAETDNHAGTPQLDRIASHLKRDDLPAEQRPDGFDVDAVLKAVRGVAGVRDAALRTTATGAHHLRLDLAEGADPAAISRMVARMLQEQMGIDAAPAGGLLPRHPAQPAEAPAPTATLPAPRSGAGAAPPPGLTGLPDHTDPPLREPRRRHPVTVPRRAPGELRGSERAPSLRAVSSEPELPQTASPPPLHTERDQGPRPIIEHVQTSTFGLDATVEVRLNTGNRTATGVASGPAVDAYVLRLCAAATAVAVDDLLREGTTTGESGRCFVEQATIVPMGSCEVAVVVVLLVCGGWVEQLAGSALVSGDPRRAVVRATLSAVNRRLAALLP